MSDESQFQVGKCRVGGLRNLTARETKLIEKLMSFSQREWPVEYLSGYQARDYLDSSSGSILLVKIGDTEKRRFGHELALAKYRDDDGTYVSIALNADQVGQLFELDVWKVDDSKLLQPAEAALITREGSD